MKNFEKYKIQAVNTNADEQSYRSTAYNSCYSKTYKNLTNTNSFEQSLLSKITNQQNKNKNSKLNDLYIFSIYNSKIKGLLSTENRNSLTSFVSQKNNKFHENEINKYLKPKLLNQTKKHISFINKKLEKNKPPPITTYDVQLDDFLQGKDTYEFDANSIDYKYKSKDNDKRKIGNRKYCLKSFNLINSTSLAKRSISADNSKKKFYVKKNVSVRHVKNNKKNVVSIFDKVNIKNTSGFYSLNVSYNNNYVHIDTTIYRQLLKFCIILKNLFYIITKEYLNFFWKKLKTIVYNQEQNAILYKSCRRNFIKKRYSNLFKNKYIKKISPKNKVYLNSSNTMTYATFNQTSETNKKNYFNREKYFKVGSLRELLHNQSQSLNLININSQEVVSPKNQTYKRIHINKMLNKQKHVYSKKTKLGNLSTARNTYDIKLFNSCRASSKNLSNIISHRDIESQIINDNKKYFNDNTNTQKISGKISNSVMDVIFDGTGKSVHRRSNSYTNNITNDSQIYDYNYKSKNNCMKISVNSMTTRDYLNLNKQNLLKSSNFESNNKKSKIYINFNNNYILKESKFKKYINCKKNNKNNLNRLFFKCKVENICIFPKYNLKKMLINSRIFRNIIRSRRNKNNNNVNCKNITNWKNLENSTMTYNKQHENIVPQSCNKILINCFKLLQKSIHKIYLKKSFRMIRKYANRKKIDNLNKKPKKIIIIDNELAED